MQFIFQIDVCNSVIKKVQHDHKIKLKCISILEIKNLYIYINIYMIYDISKPIFKQYLNVINLEILMNKDI